MPLLHIRRQIPGEGRHQCRPFDALLLGVALFGLDVECQRALGRAFLRIDRHVEEVLGTRLKCAALEFGVNQVAGEIGVEQCGGQLDACGVQHMQMLLEAVHAQAAGTRVQQVLHRGAEHITGGVDDDGMVRCHDRQHLHRGMSRLRASLGVERP